MSHFQLRQAVHALYAGGIIAYPTEAVYGLGCDPTNEQALLDLLRLKQRPWHKGLILIAANLEQLESFIQPLSAGIADKVNQTWPGPTTWVLPAKQGVSTLLTGDHQSIAVRVTAHKQTAALCHVFGGAIVSTSANMTEMKPAKTIQQVRWALPQLDWVLSGSCSGLAKPTQIRDGLTGEILR